MNMSSNRVVCYDTLILNYLLTAELANDEPVPRDSYVYIK